MKRNSKIVFCLMLAVSLFCLCPKLSAQSRKDKVRKKYAHLLEQVQKAYYNYDFEQAEQKLDAYIKQLTRRRLKLDNESEAWSNRIGEAKRALAYAQKVLLVDSLQFVRQDIEKLIHERSPFLSKTLSFKLDSTHLLVDYHSPLARLSYYVKQEDGDFSLFCADTLLNGEVESKELGEAVNDPYYNRMNPFLLNTGLTLVFARQSKGSGNIDLYYARYNTEKKAYFKAKSLSMPFNSIYNDYLLAYDDEQGLSYLVSDRYCAKDSLVLYRFRGLPSEISDADTILYKPAGENVQADGGFAKTLDSTFVIPQPKQGKAHSVHLLLANGTVITSLESFRSPEALSYYRDMLAYEEELAKKQEYERTLCQRYKEGESGLEEEIGQLFKEIKRLKKQIKERLEECRKFELRYRNI